MMNTRLATGNQENATSESSEEDLARLREAAKREIAAADMQRAPGYYEDRTPGQNRRRDATARRDCEATRKSYERPLTSPTVV